MCWINVNVAFTTLSGEDPDIESEEDFISLVWMRPTGLQDKKGRDIYEGDVLRVEGQPQSGDFNNAIYVFESGRACFVARMIKGEVMREPVIAWMLDGSGEVIGNIYQDSHLLKEE
jgi:uncharacterized phage protein (TIGR01671 family)